MLPILQRSVVVGVANSAKGCYSTNVYTTTCLCAAQGVDPCWLSIASSPFNTIIPDILIAKLVNLDLDTMCWCTPSPCGTTADKKRLQRVTRTAKKVIGRPLPSLDSIDSYRCLSKSRAILKDHLHPNLHLFNILPSGKGSDPSGLKPTD